MPSRFSASFSSPHASRLLSVFFTAGHPGLNDTRRIIRLLAASGADLIEIGMPFSDPLADGPVIQQSSQHALSQGMSLPLLFEQLKGIRSEVNIPLILMGYLNPVMQYGFEAFCRQAADVGIDGLILPDLPLAEYETNYQGIVEASGLSNIFLITPQTSEARIRKIDELSSSFIYAVSSDSTTGRRGSFSEEHLAYFERLQALRLRSPLLIGFGIHDRETFETVSRYAAGAIIGSAFIRMLEASSNLEQDIPAFLSQFKP
jgi:tryptophan synthase alpha chain